MKMESLVIVGQLYHGEYVLESCTHNKSAEQRSNLKSSNLFLSFVGEHSRSVASIRENRGGGLKCKGQPNHENKPIDLSMRR